MIVSGKRYAGHFLELIGSGFDWGVRFTYEIQDEAGGIAQALGLAEDFADDEDVAVTELDLYNNGIFKLILDKKSEPIC